MKQENIDHILTLARTDPAFLEEFLNTCSKDFARIRKDKEESLEKARRAIVSATKWRERAEAAGWKA